MSRKFFGKTGGNADNATYGAGFRVGSNKLFVDSSHDRIGIGTTDPSAKLDVQGDANLTGDLSVDTDTLFVDVSADRVGVNNSSPTVALDVTGDIKSSGTITGGISTTSLVASSITYPTSDGTNGQILTTNGSGTLSFANAASSGITTPYDVVPAYSSTDYDIISWDATEHALKMSDPNDDTMGIAYPAFRCDVSSEFKLTVHYKGSASETGGLYVRIHEYDDELPSGKTHVSDQAQNSAGVVQEATRTLLVWHGNSAIPSDWTTSTYTYTPTSTAKWTSVVVLRWNQASASTNLFLKDLLVQQSGSGGYRNGEIIEELWSLCDGGTLQGNAATVPNVTAAQTTTTSFADLNGSEVGGYVVPSGTKTIIYTFNFYQGRLDSLSIMHYKLYYKVGSGSWTEVTSGFRNVVGEDIGMRQEFTWPFTVNASSADAGTGVLTEATPTLSFKWQVREFSTSYEARIHQTDYNPGGGTDTFIKPFVGVKAIAGS